MHAEDAYIFRHALLREAGYQLQLPGDRAVLHRLALSVLEQLFGDSDNSVAQELAEHALAAREAASQPEVERLCASAGGYLLAAARYELERWQYQNAARLSERGANLEGIAPRLQMDLYAELGRALTSGRAFDGAMQAYERARELALQLGDSSFAAGVGVSQAMLEMRRGNFDAAQREASAALEIARALSEPVLEGRCWQALGQVFGRRGSSLEALEATQSAERLYRAAGDETRLAGVLVDLAVRLWMVGKHRESDSVAEQALAISRARNDVPRVANVLTTIANNKADAGEVDAALAVYTQSNELALRIGAQEVIGVNEMAVAILLTNNDRHQEALESLDAAQRRFSEIGARDLLCSVANNRAAILLALGRLDDAAREIDHADTLNRELNREVGLVINKINRGELARIHGNHGAAAKWFTEAGDSLKRLGRLPLAAHALREAAGELNVLGEHQKALTAAQAAHAILAEIQPGAELRLTICAELARSLGLCRQGHAAADLARKTLADPELAPLPQRLEVERLCNQALGNAGL